MSAFYVASQVVSRRIQTGRRGADSYRKTSKLIVGRGLAPAETTKPCVLRRKIERKYPIRTATYICENNLNEPSPVGEGVTSIASDG